MLTIDELALDGGPEKRADGLLAIEFVLTAVGVQNYSVGGKKVRVLKNPDNFHTDSYFESARSAPVTREHVFHKVTPNDRDRIVGLGFDSPARLEEGEIRHGATLFDKGAIADIVDRRIRAVSAGFHSKTVQNSGIWTDSNGVKHEYDAIQTAPRVNHIALTAAPRVRDAKIKFDSTDVAIWLPEQTNHTMEDLKQLLEQLVKDSKLDEAASTALTQTLEGYKQQIAALDQELNAAREQLAAAEKQLEEAPTMDSLQEAHQSRIELAALIADSCDLPLVEVIKMGDERSMYAAALEKLGQTIVADSSVDMLAGMFHVASQKPVKSEKTAAAALQSVVPEKTSSDRMAAMFAADLERNQKGHK